MTTKFLEFLLTAWAGIPLIIWIGALLLIISLLFTVIVVTLRPNYFEFKSKKRTIVIEARNQKPNSKTEESRPNISSAPVHSGVKMPAFAASGQKAIAQ